MFLTSAVELVVLRQSFLNLTEIEIDETQRIVRPCIIRVDVEGLLKSLYGLGVASDVEVDEPQIIAQFRILRRQHNHLCIYLQCVYKLAELVVCSAKVLVCSYETRI